MQTRKFDELISYFNRKVSSMDIDQKYKMELLGMITAIGLAHEKEMPHWVSCSERLPKRSGTYLVCQESGTVYTNHFYRSCVDPNGQWGYSRRKNPVAWMPLPEPYKGEEA